MGAEEQGPLAPYLDTSIKLFIADRVLLAMTNAALLKMGFTSVLPVAVKPNYFQAMRQLFGEITRFQGLVLVNHPPQKLKDSAGIVYEDYTFADFYRGVASLNKSSRRSTSDLLQKCVPIFVSPQDADIRQRTLEDLFPFGIMAAFMLQVLDLHATQQEQLEQRYQELEAYLLEFFTHREAKTAELKEYQSAEDLRQRRSRYEQIMAEVAKLKQARDYDRAVALCRQAAEVLPTDPGAYLEGGRLLVKKKKYPPAMQMFRDAERVAQNLPTPSQEMANLRVDQVKEYVRSRREQGLPIDQERVDQYLSEALEGFQTALQRAGQIRLVRGEKDQQVQRDVLAGIAENIMTLELAETVGGDNPLVLKLGKLAHDTLSQKLRSEGELDPKYLVQFGLMAFFEGDLTQALRYLLEAAQVQESFHDACMKLNYIGTQLRRQERFAEAEKVYLKLLELGPSFRGVVLMNLAIARQSRALALEQQGDPRAGALTAQAVATAVEALYVDPLLPQDENFYANTVMAAGLGRMVELVRQALESATCRLDPSPGDADPVCWQAREELERMLGAGKDRQALQYMFVLAQKLPRFFLEFHKHGSEKILGFAQRLHPLLAHHDSPKMRTFGKVLAVLVSKGRQAHYQGDYKLDPRLVPVMKALERADQAGAARQLALALMSQSELAGQSGVCADQTLLNLCREIDSKLGGIEFERFGL